MYIFNNNLEDALGVCKAIGKRKSALNEQEKVGVTYR